MDKALLRTFLEQQGIRVQKETRHYLVASCPFAKWLHKDGTDRDASWGVSDSHPSVYHCFACGSRGRLEYLFHFLQDRTGTSRKAQIDWLAENDRETVESVLRRPVCPEPLVLNDRALHWDPVAQHPDATRYLESRGVGSDQSEFWDFRWDERNRRVVFPVRTLGLNGAVGRSVDEKRYYNYFGMRTAECLGGYHRLTENRRLLLVEGIFDLTRSYHTVVPLGWDVVCVFKASCSDRQIELIKNTDKAVTCAFDQDPAGESGWRLLQQAGLCGLGRVRWDEKKDLGSFTNLELQEVFG